MKKFTTLTVSLVLMLSAGGSLAAGDIPVLDTSSQIKLSGMVEVEDHYGPPNFGQTPSKDQKVKVPVLILDAPFVVRKNEADGFYADHPNVAKVQLLSSAKGIKFLGLIRKHIVATGTLMEAISGSHYTDVLEDVSSVEER